MERREEKEGLFMTSAYPAADVSSLWEATIANFPIHLSGERPPWPSSADGSAFECVSAIFRQIVFLYQAERDS